MSRRLFRAVLPASLSIAFLSVSMPALGEKQCTNMQKIMEWGEANGYDMHAYYHVQNFVRNEGDKVVTEPYFNHILVKDDPQTGELTNYIAFRGKGAGWHPAKLAEANNLSDAQREALYERTIACKQHEGKPEFHNYRAPVSYSEIELARPYDESNVASGCAKVKEHFDNPDWPCKSERELVEALSKNGVGIAFYGQTYFHKDGNWRPGVSKLVFSNSEGVGVHTRIPTGSTFYSGSRGHIGPFVYGEDLAKRLGR